MSTKVSVTEARAALPDLIDRVTEGEEVTLTRHGQPVAVMVRPDALRSRRADAALAAADELDRMMRAGASRLRGRSRLTSARADELVAEMRVGRGRR
jgi:antitoxin (DNA-binding transcriptional repressor) of toxin-antitoxin stability system